ncbi:hypothetical protein GH714_040720 [Hevea brasiliensis]|uniref:Uncharacterized protein n=1 Tax=Hevea brasiliensis TaxID=3981 RepID=A0A6A6MTM6_HEVBR|nr:hypothetical protein GH714_040720 [Hevea brasiliensis]
MGSYAKELHYDYCRIWFRILGLSGDEAFEEIENDSQVNNMLDYNSSADEIDIYFVENAKLVTFIHEHVSHIEKDNDEHIAAIEKDSEGDKESFNVDMDSDSTDSDYNINSDADEDGSSELCIGSSDISEMYIDLKGSDDDIFSGANDKGSKEDLNEDDYEEFCEKAANEDELHSLHSASEDDVPYPEFNESFGFANPQLCMGMKFSSHIIFRRALKEWAIRNGFGFKLLKNTSTRITAICHHLCGFKGLIKAFKEVGLGVEHRQHDWEKTNLLDIQPAMVRKPAVRPKKRRIKAIDEPRNPFKLTRAKGTIFVAIASKKAIMLGDGEQNINEGHNVTQSTSTTGSPPSKNGQTMLRKKHRLMTECTTSASQPTTSTIDNV